LIGIPVYTVFLSSLKTGIPGQESTLTVKNYVEAFTDPATMDAILNTALFTVCTLAVALLFCIPIVWLMSRTDLPFKGIFYVLFTLGVLIPVFLKTMGWIILVSPRIGILNVTAMNLLGLEKPLFNVYSVPWMGIIQGLAFVPLAFFMLSAAYQAMDPTLEEAAYISGANKIKTILRINIPITFPAILAVFIYLTMLTVAVFETPALLGLPGRIFLLSSLIFFSISPETGLPNYGLAASYGSILLVFAFISMGQGINLRL